MINTSRWLSNWQDVIWYILGFALTKITVDIIFFYIEKYKKKLLKKIEKRRKKMTAREMFESIGYHQVVISPKYCSYSFDDGGYIKSIEFIGIKKEIRLHDLETYNDNKSQGVFVLDEYELKAINKQMEELGWI